MKTFGIKACDCMDITTPCDRIILDGTRFIRNIATLFGCSIMITKPDNVLIGCEARYAWTRGFMDADMIRTRLNHSTLATIYPKESCKSWEDIGLWNDTSKVVVGTFAHNFILTINSNHKTQIVGNSSFGFVLKNAESGKPLPDITITTLDAFGNKLAPSLLEGNTLTLSSSEGSHERVFRCSLENGMCTTTYFIGFVLRKNYTIQIYPTNDYLLKATNLTISVRNCTINEESRWEMTLCAKCDATSFNFNLSSSAICRPCSENANCTTRYIKPKDGYWHKSPCHERVKRCIVEKACEVQDRIEKLNNLTRLLNGCNMTKATLANYSNAQCHEVSMLSFVKDSIQEQIDDRVMKGHCVEVVGNLMVFHQVSSV